MNTNENISLKDAPLEVRIKYLKLNLLQYINEEKKLEKELEAKSKEIKKILEFHRKEKMLLIEKMATPLSTKESKTYTIKFIKSVGMWNKYCDWLLKEKGYK